MGRVRQGDLAILKKIFRMVGSPTEESWPGYKELPKARVLRWKKEVRCVVGDDVLVELTAAHLVTVPHKQKPGLLRARLKLPKHAFIGSYLSDTGLDLLTRMLALDPNQYVLVLEIGRAHV